ncbi:hypothetical protein I6F09_34495 [Bradyrhizobium sp. IC3195]|uniref:hypothetical protein n=1 Tax=Bradyrhizobium sp. IC3195 TaxID=2793804 RepID=UPI001CD1E337|nr:hypothetical protein [Bradyrhizobium sp. IC3195]MCA1472961.1 hypothetical protein [Bradyrhizobium sp. IC3195]
MRTPADLGAVIRDRRKHLQLDQATLTTKIGVSRQWVIDIERGHPCAELLSLELTQAIKKIDESVVPSVSQTGLLGEANCRDFLQMGRRLAKPKRSSITSILRSSATSVPLLLRRAQ